MNLIFNELSFLPLTDKQHTVNERFLSMIRTFKKAKNNHGFNHIVWPSAYAQMQVMIGQTYSGWVVKLPPKELNEVMTFTKRPFIEETVDGQIDELDTYYFEDKEEGIEQTHCVGLATAHISENASISLPGLPVWEKEKIGFFKTNLKTGAVGTVEVFNVSTEASIDYSAFVAFVETISKIELVETTLQPSEKNIHLRDDHGKNVLTAFGKRILNSPYVVGVINSLPFNSHTTRFIRNSTQNGIVEIVLHWEDKGYGMAIQTSGRNLRETQAIAEILRDEYDK